MPSQENNSNLLVAVVGATGQQGGATARALLEAGVRVRGLTRNADSAAARSLAAAGAEIVTADLSDSEGARNALTDVDRLFSMATMSEGGPEGEIALGTTINRAAKETGVTHIVYSSVGGAELLGELGGLGDRSE